MTSNANFSAPTIRTSRLLLRAHRAVDLLSVHKLWSDPEVTRFIGSPQTEEEAWGRLLRYVGHWSLLDFGYWVIEEEATGRFVGEVGFANFCRAMLPPLGDTPELGWVVSPEFAGFGYATEAARAVLDWGNKHWQVRRIACIVNPAHLASINVAEKCGFARIADVEYRGASVAAFELWLGRSMTTDADSRLKRRDSGGEH